MSRIVNPFTPAFGGKPSHFFGRTEELSLMRSSLREDNSPHRAVFLTGTRGCGKTTLLERLSAIAGHYGWRCIDVHSAHASEAIVRQLVRASTHTEECSLSPSGAGFSLGSTSVSDTRTYDELDLSELLLAACKAMPSGKGIFISVDEAQKIPEDDMENLCAAYQMSLRKGMATVLVLAGLPGSKEAISSYAGCTFMQRAPEVKLSSLLVRETYEAFERMLADAAGCTHGPEVVTALSEASKGHPYLMQLLGYYLVEREAEQGGGKAVELHAETVGRVLPIAFQDYRSNVLEPSLARLGDGTIRYLEALGSLLDDQRRASTSAIARTLGKTEQQCSPYRQRLIDRRIIVASGWGYVSYGLPYLDWYFEQAREPVPRADTWVN